MATASSALHAVDSADQRIKWREQVLTRDLSCQNFGAFDTKLEEIDDAIWNVYFGPLKLGRFNERHMRIEDQFCRVRRDNV
jgi:putative transposase